MENRSKTISRKLKTLAKIAKYTSILVITIWASIANIKANTIKAQTIVETIYKKYDSKEIPPASHEKLLASNENYKKNFEKAENLFLAGADKACVKIAGEGKLSENDRKVFLITTYYCEQKLPSTNKDKKNFLILYFDDTSWNDASADKINTKFTELMKDAKIFLRDGNAGELSMPVYVSQATKDMYSDVDF